MKSRIKLSMYSTLVTLIITGVILAGCIASYHEKTVFFTALAILLMLIVSGLMYAPTAINADPKYLTVCGLLKNRKIRMDDIENVELFQPTMGAIRLFASGGYMGYWGIFREGDIGRYMAFYGKASDCFLVRLKNGDKYVLGCENPSAIVDYIKKQIL